MITWEGASAGSIDFPFWVGPPTRCRTRSFRLVRRTRHGVVGRIVTYDVTTMRTTR